MKTLHSPHWLRLALVTGAALLALTGARAQSTGAGAGAVFEGRPAMSGAQGGQGAMAGPPQGGIGLQGSEGSQLRLRPPPASDTSKNMPQGRMEDPPAALARSTASAPRVTSVDKGKTAAKPAPKPKAAPKPAAKAAADAAAKPAP